MGAGGARRGLDPGASVQGTARTSPSISLPPTSTVVTRTTVRVPPACLEAELADEIISQLTRNQRDSRLAMNLRDYSVANQACQEEARPR